jgi:hypothetical protein
VRSAIAIAFVCASLAWSARSAGAEPTQPYVVQPGDSCLGIAIRLLGTRSAVREIHRLNPQLGALPHVLVAGSLLTIPALAPTGPDARISRALGDVKIRKPTTAAWDAAQRGMDLFRAYRVGAATEASAELTFGDDALLEMRERTIVVIYGPEKRLAQLIHATAELERGTLAARLSDLDGKAVVVRTPAAEAKLLATSAVISTRDGGASTLSNHRGKDALLRGRTKQRASVKVPAGMGSRVLPGKAPEPPRPLPATPIWSTPSGLAFAGTSGAVELAWSAVERASEYRIAVVDRSGDPVRAMIVPALAARANVPLDPGVYQLRIAALDADGLESAPSAALGLQVIQPVFAAPNGRVPAAGAAPPRVVARGTTLVAPDGVLCSAGPTTPQARTVLWELGAVDVTCQTPDGQRSPSMVLEVVSLVPAPPTAAPAIRASSPVPTAAARRTGLYAEAGAYAGFHTLALRGASGLGAPFDRASALDDGPTAGVRLALATARWGVESELGATSLDRLAVMGGATAILLRTHAMLRLDREDARFRLLAGIGVNFTRGDSETVLSWGGSAGFTLRGVELRFDLRHELSDAAAGGVAHGLQATAGASFQLDR